MMDGMFTTPEQIRAQRADDILKQYENTAMMGGSMDQLLGQVAAAGSNVGSLMAESGARMFGLQTAEEANAAKIQEAAKAIDWNNPEDLNQMAKYLNDVGMTEQAIKVLEKRQGLLDREVVAEDRSRDEEDRQRRIAQGKLRARTETVMVPRVYQGEVVLDPLGNPVMEPKTVQYDEEWNEKEKRWVRVKKPEASSVGTSSGFVTSDSGAARVPQGTTVVPPKGKYQTAQEATDAEKDPWSEFSRY